VQVYAEFDVGTGKPSAEERARAPHHLIDIVKPDQAMDAAQWAALADAKINEISGRGKQVIVCGGTFLWVRALLHGLADAPPANERIRETHKQRARDEGRAALHAELLRVDPETAARLNENDFVRVSRALEVYEQSGVPLSRWHAEHAFRAVRHPHRLIGVRHATEELDARIARRVRHMLEAEWVAEVEALMARGYSGVRAMRSVGYKQIHDAALAGVIPDATELGEQIYRATRVFARRQRTWLRDQPVEWVDPERAFSGAALEALRRSVKSERE
jgi:tRNA dimethylallyltransferase